MTGQLNNYYKECIADNTKFKFVTKETKVDGWSGSYIRKTSTFSEFLDGEWVSVTSNEDDDYYDEPVRMILNEFPDCCGIGVVSYLQYPRTEKPDDKTIDMCIAKQLIMPFQNYNYIQYAGVVSDTQKIFNRGEIAQYKKICASLERLGFVKLNKPYPNKNNGNKIQIMGALTLKENLE